MSTGIEWTDETWNPTLGCSKVSEGCDRCYAIGQANRNHLMGSNGYQPALTIGRVGAPNGLDWTGELRPMPTRLDQPKRWTRPRRIFVNSMSDLFHPDLPSDFIRRVVEVMHEADHHTYQVLTKRPQRMRSWVNGEWGFPMPEHVWLGTSIESDRWAWRTNQLRDTWAATRFVSLEPLLGPLPSLDLTGIDWCIVGAESGRGARPMDLGWVRELRDQCAHTGTALFVKQLSSGGRRPIKELADFPPDLRIRQWPVPA